MSRHANANQRDCAIASGIDNSDDSDFALTLPFPSPNRGNISIDRGMWKLAKVVIRTEQWPGALSEALCPKDQRNPHRFDGTRNGRVGMNRKAMMAMNDYVQNVCTIDLLRVAEIMVVEIHHARLSTAPKNKPVTALAGSPSLRLS